MNVEEARRILELYRPGASRAVSPEMAEALQLARRSPGLLQWFEEQQALDAALRDQLNSLPVPPNLYDQLLRLPQTKAPRLRVLQPLLAAAACVLLFVLGGGWWWQSRPVSFEVMHHHLMEQSWGASPHLAFRSSQWQEMKTWLATQEVAPDFQLPEALNHARLKGCTLLHWRGHVVPMFCLYEAHRHVHLYVVDHLKGLELPPEELPTLTRHGPLNIVSWADGGKAYVLTGFSPASFVKKFRRDRRWQLAS